jgi:hypothetical protein
LFFEYKTATAPVQSLDDGLLDKPGCGTNTSTENRYCAAVPFILGPEPRTFDELAKGGDGRPPPRGAGGTHARAVPLQWATTQNNLGNALTTHGERESGTVRLEEAVAA